MEGHAVNHAEQENCSVCYDEMTEDTKNIVCWNEHTLCDACYKECLKPRTTDGGFNGASFNINTGCPTCREPMFDWSITTTVTTTTTTTTTTRTPRRCGVCREAGHDRRNCPEAYLRRLEAADVAAARVQHGRWGRRLTVGNSRYVWDRERREWRNLAGVVERNLAGDLIP
jgi:hypothetical protein